MIAHELNVEMTGDDAEQPVEIGTGPRTRLPHHSLAAAFAVWPLAGLLRHHGYGEYGGLP